MLNIGDKTKMEEEDEEQGSVLAMLKQVYFEK
jgi:hypothetical protein